MTLASKAMMPIVSGSKARISRSDMECLRSILRRRLASDVAQSDRLHELQDLLDSAQVVDTLPAAVAALGAKVSLRNLHSGEESVFTIVLPSQANISEGMISILAPMGAAVLGRSVGEVFQFNTPGGTRTYRLEGILSDPGRRRSAAG